MNIKDEKIFQDLKGLLSWWQDYIYKPNSDTEINSNELDNSKIRLCYKEKLQNFFKFIGLNLRDFEVDALVETIKPETTPLHKKNLIEFHDIYNIFVKDQKKSDKEKKEMKDAFVSMLQNPSEELIPLAVLEKNLARYNNRYPGAMELVLIEIKNSEFIKDGNFYFLNFLDKYYGQISKYLLEDYTKKIFFKINFLYLQVYISIMKRVFLTEAI